MAIKKKNTKNLSFSSVLKFTVFLLQFNQR